MNGLKILKKIFKYFLIVVFSLISIIYIGLNIYVKSKEIKVDSNKLLNATTVYLSNEQIKIASYVLNKDKNPKFHNYFFLINDAFSFRNHVALLTATNYIAENSDTLKYESIELQIIDLATKRYVMKNIDYRICYNYLFSKFYFGKELYGLQNASNFYYSKDYKNLTQKEFISLCLLLNNPAFYDFTDENNKKRCAEKINEIYSNILE